MGIQKRALELRGCKFNSSAFFVLFSLYFIDVHFQEIAFTFITIKKREHLLG